MQNKQRLLIILTVAASTFLMSMTDVYAPGAPPVVKVAPPSTANVGEQKKITFTLTNPQTKQQPYVSIIQVTDEEGFTDQLSWIVGVLETHQEFRIYQSWIPEKSGDYEVETFLWDPDTLESLGPIWSMKVIVEE